MTKIQIESMMGYVLREQDYENYVDNDDPDIIEAVKKSLDDEKFLADEEKNRDLGLGIQKSKRAAARLKPIRLPRFLKSQGDDASVESRKTIAPNVVVTQTARESWNTRMKGGLKGAGKMGMRLGDFKNTFLAKATGVVAAVEEENVTEGVVGGEDVTEHAFHVTVRGPMGRIVGSSNSQCSDIALCEDEPRISDMWEDENRRRLNQPAIETIQEGSEESRVRPIMEALVIRPDSPANTNPVPAHITSSPQSQIRQIPTNPAGFSRGGQDGYRARASHEIIPRAPARPVPSLLDDESSVSSSVVTVPVGNGNARRVAAGVAIGIPCDEEVYGR
jgi:hypothetical protein